MQAAVYTAGETLIGAWVGLAGVLPMRPPIDEYMLEVDGPAARPLLETFAAACERLVAARPELELLSARQRLINEEDE